VTLIAMPAAPPAAAPPVAFVEDTQKIPIPDLDPPASTPKPIAKVELKKITTPLQPAAAPTPRGVPAPAPKRASGQFQSAPITQSREESVPAKTDPAIGRREPAKSQVSVTDAIAEVFDATQDLYLEAALTRQKIAEKMLDIALTHIPSESGTFYLADVNGHELVFAAVRGPKADAIKRSGMKVKVGQGIIGFCAQEGVCLLVSDIQKDPRYHAEVASAIGYQPRDTVCASAEKDGRLFGALQLINSKKGFDAAQMEVARYIGLTAAALLERLEG
jgi:putative methionine-R-sulfoxide reductase with GAF domain